MVVLFFNYFFNFIYLCLTLLGLHSCAGFFSSAESEGYSPVAGHRLLTVAAFRVVAHRL